MLQDSCFKIVHSFNQSILEQELFKKDSIKIGTPWRLLTIAFITLLTTAVLFLGLKFGYLPFLNSQLENTDKKIEDLTASINEQDAQKIFTFYSQLFNINDLLRSRYSSANLLNIIEANTLKNLYFTSFNFNLEEKQIAIEGIAPSYEALSQEMEILKKAKEIKNIKLESARTLEEKGGGIRFAIRAEMNL